MHWPASAPSAAIATLICPCETSSRIWCAVGERTKPGPNRKNAPTQASETACIVKAASHASARILPETLAPAGEGGASTLLQQD